ncbi:MAG: PAS domain S-box protein, partial [Planctomycetota bacterium]
MLLKDIRNRLKQAEDKIKVLAKFPEENPNPVMRVFEDGKILYNNNASMALLDSWGFQTTKRLPNNYIKIVSDALHSGLSNAVEVECENCVFSLTFAPIMVEGYVNIYGLDITERKEADNKIKGLAKFPEENPNPVMRVCKDGKLLYNNKASIVLLDSWGSQTTKRLPNNYIKIVSDALHSGLSNAVEVECKNCVFSLTFAPIMEEDYVNIYGLDITERKEVTNAFKQSEEQYRTLVQTIPDIIYKIDENGFFTFLNNSVRTLGYKPEELIGKHFSNILHPDDIKSFSRFTVLKEHSGKESGDKNVTKLFDERRTLERMTKNLKLRLIPKDQDMLKRDIQGRSDEIITFVEITATGIYHNKEDEENSGFYGTVGIITDITDKIKMQAEMVWADQFALIGKMAAGLSHEINNPISGIINCAQLIMDESKKNTRLYKFSKIIIEESKRIATLTKNLLYLSRRTVDKKSHVQIYETIYNSLELMMIQLKKDN